MDLSNMMRSLKNEPINTWFDLGLFLDRVRENRKKPAHSFTGSFPSFKKHLQKGGIGFVTFWYGVDGVSIEIGKYAQSFRNILKDVPLHFIGGEFNESFSGCTPHPYYEHEIKRMNGFDNWKFFEKFFLTKFKRGDEVYNDLIHDFWKETLIITEQLGEYVLDHDIKLLFPVNTNSNPGNASMALAIVLVSEYLGIPVINNNHDFFWESGASKADKKRKNLPNGPRDFFFTNYDVGEFFSIIETIFPWDSRSWLSVNINYRQSQNLIKVKGHNPANVTEITTAIDTSGFKKLKSPERSDLLKNIGLLFSPSTPIISTTSTSRFLKKQIDEDSPIIFSNKHGNEVRFDNNNFFFLQPTRIISRKNIETNFLIIKKLFSNKSFREYLEENPKSQITLFVTGRVAPGHSSYFKSLVQKFGSMIKTLPSKFRDRVFLAFSFGAFDFEKYREKLDYTLKIEDFFNVASMIMLPSSTEGRGLPIIEAAASQTPIVVRRYYPERVYAQVVGEHLEDKKRFRVLEFKKDQFPSSFIDRIASFLIHPSKHWRDLKHNQRATQLRYAFPALQENIDYLLHKLYLQLHPNHISQETAETILTSYTKKLQRKTPLLKEVIGTKNRQHLAGYHQLSFLIYLKSLIDPSYFRVEEQNLRGLIMGYAQRLVEQYKGHRFLSTEKIHTFYNCVEHLFLVKHGHLTIRVDHSLNFRYRNERRHYYRNLTIQQLAGAVNLAFKKLILSPKHGIKLKQTLFHKLPFRESIIRLIQSDHLAIDTTSKLQKRLRDNVSFALFPSSHIVDEVELFIVKTLRQKLGLTPKQKLTVDYLQKHKRKVQPAYIFVPQNYTAHTSTHHALQTYIRKGTNHDLSLFVKYGLCRIVSTRQHGIGVHFAEIGNNALNILNRIRKSEGFIIAKGEDASMTTDIVDLEVFHIGSAKRELTAAIMGIPRYSGFVQWVPAGLRPTLAYPTPIQNSVSFHNFFQSSTYKKAIKKFGEKYVLDFLKEDAEENGSPLKVSLEKLAENSSKKKLDDASYSYLTGVYRDGLPYYGVIAQVKNIRENWMFDVAVDSLNPKPVVDFFNNYSKKSKSCCRVAWNGGYIVNPELVGKLGLPAKYIGSPLGLVITHGKIVSPPLFNKPAILISKNGSIRIQRVNVKKGITLYNPKNEKQIIICTSKHYHNVKNSQELGYLDLLRDNREIDGDGRVLCELAGNTVKEITQTKKGQKYTLVGIGLSLLIPKKLFPSWIKDGVKLGMKIPSFDNIQSAVEAGPKLVTSGKLDIQMKKEGWNTENSIRTQASRTDYENMRGPKIAIGLDREKNLYIIAINGRLRESVGARYKDIARVLRKRGIVSAMAFDPGGSVTLVLDGETLNISPYNPEYEKNPFTLPSTPRPVANAVIGCQKCKK